jgi:hypothetical protein
MRQVPVLIERFAKDERGVFAVLFGVMAIVLVALGGATVDYVTLEQTRARAQIALDAAALALQPEINVAGMTNESIRQRAEAIMVERIGDPNIVANVERIEVDQEGGRLFLAGRFTMPTIFVGLVGVTELGASVSSEVVRGSVDIEVAVSLDVTGSMDGQDVIDLKASITSLVQAIVQDDQTLVTSRVALVPYSQAVNAGDHAVGLRGPERGPKNITKVTWLNSTTRNITGITKAYPPVVTSNGHGYNNDDLVYIWDVKGMTQVNGRVFTVANKNNNSFQLKSVNGNNYGTFTSNNTAKMRKCLHANCTLEVTSNGHGYAVGEYVHMTNVEGMPGVNDVTYSVASRTNNTLMLSGLPTSGAGDYTRNGKLHCTWQSATEGCTYYRYQSRDGNFNTYALTTCVTERSPNGTTDLPPSTTLMGRNYPPPGNPCLPNAFVPLTADKTLLTNRINALTAAGSTSGSMGVLMTWYMLAPNFGYLWPDSQPEPYRRQNLLKAAVIMTDGEFNTVHCEGTVSRSSTTGSGGTPDHNKCYAPNGDPYPQARAYCDAMKSNGIRVYTVGFAITAGSTAAELLTYCATTAADFYLASNGSQLRDAFQQIARNISALRLTM